MSKHTPGPWVYQYWCRRAGEESFQRHRIITQSTEDRLVAQTYGNNAEANARLIAAAPDMKVELQNCYKLLFSYVFGDTPEMCAMAEAESRVLELLRKIDIGYSIDRKARGD